MTCRDDSLRARLDDYVDGVLAPAWAAEVERHLESCPACAAEVQALRALLTRAAGLPPSMEPPRDLWRDIAARLGSPAAAVRGALATGDPDATATPARAVAARRGVHPAWAWSGWVAAAACLALVLAGRDGDTGRAVPVAGGYAQAQRGTVLAGLRDWEAGSLQASDEYLAALDAAGQSVPAAASAEIARNLQALDLAIAETRAALLADPDNTALARLLGTFYDERIALLRRATRLTMQL